MKAKCRNCGHQSEEERCPKCDRLMPQRWFIVVGHEHGCVDAESVAVLAHTTDAAKAQFRETMDQTNEQEGPGHIYVDMVWDCGQDQPKLV